ncbi:class I SAM-dependent methyltransferase [Streptomyces capparidis]
MTTTAHTQAAAEQDWRRWQESWDRQQEWYLPDREERFRVMLDMVEALVGEEPVVLDLACGTGTITDRLLRRLPKATSTGVDQDPVLLTIARGYFERETRVRFVSADLTDPRWPEKLPRRRFDAVLTATALHWLSAEQLTGLYGQLAGLVRDGGVFLNADHMPDPSTPRINEAHSALLRARRERARAEGVLDWESWWRALEGEECFAEALARRREIYGGDGHTESEEPPAWHAARLREAGFGEARAVWCSVSDALMLAVK